MADPRVPAGLEAGPGVIALYQTFGPSHRWWVVLVGMMGSFATLLTATIVNIAIPDIMGALGVTMDQAQWLATAFLAPSTVTMLLAAWSIRALGAGPTYNLSMTVFIAGSLLGGVAQTTEVLLIARVIQGAAAGLIMPLTMVMISQVFPVRQRGRAMGLMSVGTVLAPGLGPTVGGFLVDELSWRWVFLAAIPVVVISMPMASAFFPGREEQGPRPSFDWTGVALCGFFIVALLFALSEGQRFGWYEEHVVISLALGIVAFVGWVVWELHAEEPILELRLFTNPGFVAAAIVTFTVGVGLYGSTYIFPLFLQRISGLIATESGLIMAPAGIAMAVLFPVAGHLADISSPRRLIVIGLVLFAWSSYAMFDADAFTPVLELALWYVVGRVGLACIFPSLSAAAINPLRLAMIPHGAGATNFLRQLGGVFGVAFVSLALKDQTAFYWDHISASQNWDNAGTMELMRLGREQLGYLGVPGYPRFERAFGLVVAVIREQSSMLAYREAFVWIAGVFALTLIPAWFIASNPALRGEGARGPEFAVRDRSN
jgi:EmrB/QacA subfamily drug resistance transporter